MAILIMHTPYTHQTVCLFKCCLPGLLLSPWGQIEVVKDQRQFPAKVQFKSSFFRTLYAAFGVSNLTSILITSLSLSEHFWKLSSPNHKMMIEGTPSL